jgi:hypothetical protein
MHASAPKVYDLHDFLNMASCEMALADHGGGSWHKA